MKGGPFAHSANEKGEWHDAREHLESVARPAPEFAEPFGAGNWAASARLSHNHSGLNLGLKDSQVSPTGRAGQRRS